MGIHLNTRYDEIDYMPPIMSNLFETKTINLDLLKNYVDIVLNI